MGHRYKYANQNNTKIVAKKSFRWEVARVGEVKKMKGREIDKKIFCIFEAFSCFPISAAPKNQSAILMDFFSCLITITTDVKLINREFWNSFLFSFSLDVFIFRLQFYAKFRASLVADSQIRCLFT